MYKYNLNNKNSRQSDTRLPVQRMKIRVHKAKNKQKRNKFSIIKRTQTTNKEGDTWQRTQKKLKRSTRIY